MITSVTNSFDMRKALNENLHGLLTKKRPIATVKEVNNTLGKILCDVKMEIDQNHLIGNRGQISWFDRNIKPQIENGFHEEKLYTLKNRKSIKQLNQGTGR